MNTEKVYFCIFAHFRYLNKDLMSPGHDWAAKNTENIGKVPGLLWRRAFHISPDRGSGIYGFDTKENMQKFLPIISNELKNYSRMFEAKLTIETGITSPELCQDFKK